MNGSGGAGPSKDKENEIVLGPDGKPLAKAPSMILKTEDNKSGKRAWRKDQGGESQPRRKKKKACVLVGRATSMLTGGTEEQAAAGVLDL